MGEHGAENVTACRDGWCRAGAIRAGEDPDKVSCYLCRPTTVTPPGLGETRGGA